MNTEDLKQKYEAYAKLKDDLKKLETIINIVQQDLYTSVIETSTPIIEKYLDDVSDDDNRVAFLKHVSKEVLWDEENFVTLTNRFQHTQYTFHFRLSQNDPNLYGLVVPLYKHIYDFKGLSGVHYGMFAITVQTEWDLEHTIFQSYDLLDIQGYIKKLCRDHKQ